MCSALLGVIGTPRDVEDSPDFQAEIGTKSHLVARHGLFNSFERMFKKNTPPIKKHQKELLFLF